MRAAAALPEAVRRPAGPGALHPGAAAVRPAAAGPCAASAVRGALSAAAAAVWLHQDAGSAALSQQAVQPWEPPDAVGAEPDAVRLLLPWDGAARRTAAAEAAALPGPAEASLPGESPQIPQAGRGFRSAPAYPLSIYQ